MDDVVRVRFGERGADLGHDVAEAILRERPLVAQDDAEVLPLHELHHDVEGPVLLLAPEVEDLDHVRMVEPARRLRLPLEPPDDGRVLEQGRLEHLQDDRTIEGEVAGAVDLSHAALPDQLLDVEATRDRSPDEGIGRLRRERAGLGLRRRERGSAVDAESVRRGRQRPQAARAGRHRYGSREAGIGSGVGSHSAEPFSNGGKVGPLAAGGQLRGAASSILR